MFVVHTALYEGYIHRNKYTAYIHHKTVNALIVWYLSWSTCYISASV